MDKNNVTIIEEAIVQIQNAEFPVDWPTVVTTDKAVSKHRRNAKSYDVRGRLRNLLRRAKLDYTPYYVNSI